MKEKSNKHVPWQQIFVGAYAETHVGLVVLKLMLSYNHIVGPSCTLKSRL